MDDITTISRLHKILDLLEHFCERKERKISITKVASIMNLSIAELDALLEIILRCQSIFEASLQNQKFYRVWNNGNYYLSTKNVNTNTSCMEICLSTTHLQLLNDIIYYFNHINKGIGFDIRFPSTNLLKKIKSFKKIHPHFFEYRGNGLLYPSEFALKVGEIVKNYHRLNKPISTISCENCIITIT
ncbi:MAG: hypothetical protein EAX89_14560 [Candidatus Lokiarchaeota archaeon]|nr:hypothetical protein [Candidatus Lokiarchaeota archaeon]